MSEGNLEIIIGFHANPIEELVNAKYPETITKVLQMRSSVSVIMCYTVYSVLCLL